MYQYCNGFRVPLWAVAETFVMDAEDHSSQRCNVGLCARYLSNRTEQRRTLHAMCLLLWLRGSFAGICCSTSLISTSDILNNLDRACFCKPREHLDSALRHCRPLSSILCALSRPCSFCSALSPRSSEWLSCHGQVTFQSCCTTATISNR